jgi:hypothetical protein
MKTFKWKCEQCNTINTDVGCSRCGFVPEFYLPIEGVTLKPEKIKPVKGGAPELEAPKEPAQPFIPQEPQQNASGWVCGNCGTYNGPSRKRCTSCNEPLEEEKPKRKGVRMGVIVSVFLMCFAIVGVVVVGKIIAVAQPGIFSGNIGSIFSPTGSSPTVASTVGEPTPTDEVNRVYPNPPIDGCVLWSDVTLEDAGKDLCVYGIVHTAYIGEPGQYNMRFTEDRESFRLVMTEVDELKLPEVLNECVYQTAEIKFYKDVPYMTFNSTLFELQYCQKPE